jgi:hypothetical protein
MAAARFCEKKMRTAEENLNNERPKFQIPSYNLMGATVF